LNEHNAGIVGKVPRGTIQKDKAKEILPALSQVASLAKKAIEKSVAISHSAEYEYPVNEFDDAIKTTIDNALTTIEFVSKLSEALIKDPSLNVAETMKSTVEILSETTENAVEAYKNLSAAVVIADEDKNQIDSIYNNIQQNLGNLISKANLLFGGVIVQTSAIYSEINNHGAAIKKSLDELRKTLDGMLKIAVDELRRLEANRTQIVRELMRFRTSTDPEGQKQNEELTKKATEFITNVYAAIDIAQQIFEEFDRLAKKDDLQKPYEYPQFSVKAPLFQFRVINQHLDDKGSDDDEISRKIAQRYVNSIEDLKKAEGAREFVHLLLDGISLVTVVSSIIVKIAGQKYHVIRHFLINLAKKLGQAAKDPRTYFSLLFKLVSLVL
jgi:hypothetical protein